MHTPQESNIDTQKLPYFKGTYLFQTISLGPKNAVRFREGMFFEKNSPVSFLAPPHLSLEMIQQQGQQIVLQFACVFHRVVFLHGSNANYVSPKKVFNYIKKFAPKIGETLKLKDLCL